MPSDKIEKKNEQNEQEFNGFYFDLMKSANLFTKDARVGLGKSSDPKVDAVRKNSALELVAKAMAYAKLAMKYGQGTEPDMATKQKLKEQAREEAKKIFESKGFQNLFEEMNSSELLMLLSNPEKGKTFGTPVTYDEFTKRLKDKDEFIKAEKTKRDNEAAKEAAARQEKWQKEHDKWKTEWKKWEEERQRREQELEEQKLKEQKLKEQELKQPQEPQPQVQQPQPQVQQTQPQEPQPQVQEQQPQPQVQEQQPQEPQPQPQPQVQQTQPQEPQPQVQQTQPQEPQPQVQQPQPQVQQPQPQVQQPQPQPQVQQPQPQVEQPQPQAQEQKNQENEQMRIAEEKVQEAQKKAQEAQKKAQEAQEQAQKAWQDRMNALVDILENSTQKSFFGKLKNIFVGNSQLYKKALKAMRELANGTAKDRAAAQGAIEDYIVNRGNKVRDHQYGRDRFDAFMQGLGEITTPELFMRTVKKVNGDRERNGEPTINGADYLQASPEKKQAFEKLAQQVERGKRTDIENRIQFELRKEAEATTTPEQKHQRFVKEEEQRIKDDFDGRHTAKTFTNGEHTVQLNPLENNQVYLDRLRKLDIEKSKKLGSIEDKIYQSIQRRINEHPNFRLAAQQIIQERQKADEQKLIKQGKKDPKVDYGFTIPETPISEMSKESVDMLRQHVQELQMLDQTKNPDLKIKPIKVEVPKKTVENKGAEISM